MPGYVSPASYYIDAWNGGVKDFVAGLLRKLYLSGKYDTVVDSQSLSFTPPLLARQAGWASTASVCSSPYLYSAIIGTVLSGEHPKELGVHEWDELITLPSDPIPAAAELMFIQALARVQTKADVLYWKEMERDMLDRREEHVERNVLSLTNMAEYLEGLEYHIEGPWDAIRRHADNPKAVVVVYPGKDLNRFYNTLGKITWDKSVDTRAWDPKLDIPELVEESKKWAGTIIGVERVPSGECSHPEPVFAQAVSRGGAGNVKRGENVYVFSNQTEKVRKLMGLQVRSRNLTDIKPIENPIIPPGYEVKSDSRVEVRKLKVGEARYYKDLWIHKLDSSQATGEFALLLDGYMSGATGFNYVPVPERDTGGKITGGVLLVQVYGTGAPHYMRLTRLVEMLAINRPILETMIFPWFVASAKRVQTKNYTPHPEAKQHRGIMELVDRKPHPIYGYELTYQADIVDRTIEDTFDQWFTKEQEWHQARNQESQSRGRPRGRQRQQRTRASS